MIFYFDTETTGLIDFKKPADDPAQPRLVQFGGLLVDDGAVKAEHCMIVEPDGWTVPQEAFDVHGISTEHAEQFGVAVGDVLDEWSELCAFAHLIVGYNVAYDLKIMRGELRRAGRDDEYGRIKNYSPMQACTKLCKLPPTPKMLQAGRKHPKTAKLEEAYKILIGEDLSDAHDALADAYAVKAIHEYLLKHQKETAK